MYYILIANSEAKHIMSCTNKSIHGGFPSFELLRNQFCDYSVTHKNKKKQLEQSYRQLSTCRQAIFSWSSLVLEMSRLSRSHSWIFRKELWWHDSQIANSKVSHEIMKHLSAHRNLSKSPVFLWLIPTSSPTPGHWHLEVQFQLCFCIETFFFRTSPSSCCLKFFTQPKLG